ncbi:MAG: anti-sigma factor antagonist [Williamsia sp.]|nr:anti-sigma factor antagonist [Williamsia sp.]
MRFKIDTSEKYHVITILETAFSANMTEEAQNLLLPYLEQPVRNLIVNLQDIEKVEDAAAALLINIQQTFYEQGASFVVCGLQPSVQKDLEGTDGYTELNTVPTLSEAWDIVQMEEIERDLMGEEEEPHN